jgi:hypothetical protein
VSWRLGFISSTDASFRRHVHTDSASWAMDMPTQDSFPIGSSSNSEKYNKSSLWAPNHRPGKFSHAVTLLTFILVMTGSDTDHVDWGTVLLRFLQNHFRFISRQSSYNFKTYIECSFCRLIRRSDHLISRHWYLPANWRSFIVITCSVNQSVFFILLLFN